MIFKDEVGVNTIQFGTGDILISVGFLDDPNIDYTPSIAFGEQEEGKIGRQGNPHPLYGDECHIQTTQEIHTKLTFTNTKSIDVLIGMLQQAKEDMITEKDIE